jgi:hypothetical protein
MVEAVAQGSSTLLLVTTSALACLLLCSHQVLQTINSRRPSAQDEIPVTELEQKNVRAGNIKDPYSRADTQQCMDAVSRWYACDVEKFGFSLQLPTSLEQ